MRGRTVIAGTGHTAFGKLPGRTTDSLNVEASRKAIHDAGKLLRVEPGFFEDRRRESSQYLAMKER